MGRLRNSNFSHVIRISPCPVTLKIDILLICYKTYKYQYINIFPYGSYFVLDFLNVKSYLSYGLTSEDLSMTTTIQIDSVVFNGGTSADLQAAINTAIAQGKPLQLVPGFTAPSTVTNVFTADNLVIGTTRPFRMFAAPGSVTLKMSVNNSVILKIQSSNNVEISGINFDGSYNPSAPTPILANPGLIYVRQSSRVRFEKCRVFSSSKSGILFDTCGTTVSVPYNPYGAAATFDDISGSVENCEIYSCFNDFAIGGLSSAGLNISNNVIRDCKGNGVYLSGYDFAPLANSPAVGNTTNKSYFNGGRVEGNIITDIGVVNAASSGQEGNAVVTYLANNVTISNNTIRYCKFSAVRVNACTQTVIANNNCYALGEAAIFIEEPDGGFVVGKHPVGTVVSNNIINQCTAGVAHTNFGFANAGMRLAAISGNIIRNVHRSGKFAGYGILSEGDSAITGNLIEYAETAGIILGTNGGARDMTSVGNIVRGCRWGIGITDATNSGPILVEGNLVHQNTSASGGVAASVLANAVVSMVYDPNNAALATTYSPTGAMPDGQTTKPWAVLSGNYRTISTSVVVSTDGAEALPSFV